MSLRCLLRLLPRFASSGRRLLGVGIALGLSLVAAPSLRADAGLVLENGQVLQGVSVELKGDVYQLELESGAVLTVPIKLVTGLRLAIGKPEPDFDPASRLERAGPRQLAPPTAGLADPDGPPAPTGLVTGQPRLLAGWPARPARPSEQFEVFGEPSRFVADVIDNRWEPTTDWNLDPSEQNEFSPADWVASPIDPLWAPRSAFDGERDVMKPSRSAFREDVVDSSWYPEDGFSVGRASFGFVMPDPSGSVAQSGSVDPSYCPSCDGTFDLAGRRGRWSGGEPLAPPRPPFEPPPTASVAPSLDPVACARRLLPPPAPGTTERALQVAVVDDEALAPLGEPVFEAQDGGDVVRFTLSGGDCRRFGEEVVPSTEAGALGGASSMDAALEAETWTELEGDSEKIDYAFAATALAEPPGTARSSDGFVLLRDASQLAALVADEDAECTERLRARRKQARGATVAFEPPSVLDGGTGEIVTFFSWSREEGRVERHELFVTAAGQVSVVRQLVATHVGIHECPSAE